jgi:hypothetical protein
MSKNSAVGVMIALLFLIAFVAMTKRDPASWNDVSRVAAIESLVDRGTWVIDDSPWVDQTQDKIQLGGKFYSDKMPVLSIMGAGVYAITRAGLGATLDPGCAKSGRPCAYYWLTLILVGVPVALLVLLFYQYAIANGISPWTAVLGTFALGLGTMIFPYALVLNHHAPAAVSLFASFFLLARRAASTPRRFAAAGFFAALAVSYDAVSGIIAASLFGIALVQSWRRLPYFVLGAVIPVAVTAFLDYQIAHTIIPPYLLTSAYSYPGSAFPATVGGNGTPDDYVAYSFRMFLGAQGLFAFNPLLLFALFGAVGVALRPRHPLRVAAIFTILGFGLLCIYLAVGTGNLGGVAYGERWFVNAIPVLFSFLLFAPPLSGAKWRYAAWVLFLPLLALSVFSSLQGAQHPWLYTPPPLQLTRKAQFPIIGFKWNLSLP